MTVREDLFLDALDMSENPSTVAQRYPRPWSIISRIWRDLAYAVAGAPGETRLNEEKGEKDNTIQ